jgi:hypothetical protein
VFQENYFIRGDIKMKKLIAILSLIGPAMANAEMEPILGVSVNQKGITYQVASGGCTSKKSFELRQLETNPAQLQLIRKHPDICEAFLPYGTTITYVWSELGLRQGLAVVVVNPLSVIHIQ